MNRANIWSLTDAGDSVRLAKAIKAAPTAMNVKGWSYAHGARAGLLHQSDGSWGMGNGADASASFALHIAAVRGFLDAVQVLVDAGVDTTTEVHGARANEIAADCGFGDVAKLIQHHQRRQIHRAVALEEDELHIRAAIEKECDVEAERLWDLYRKGVVTVQVLFRGGMHSNSTHAVDVPRYTTYRRLLDKIEGAVGQRVVLSFTGTKAELAAINASPSMRLAGNVPLRTLEENSDDEEGTSPLASTTRTLALRPRTLPILLHMDAPKVVARPLSHTPPLSQTPAGLNSTGNTSLSHRLQTLSESRLSNEEYLSSIKSIVAEEERGQQADGGRTTGPAKLDSESESSLLDRLYGRASDAIRNKKKVQDQYDEEGTALLLRRRKPRELSDDQATAVQRLYEQARERKEAALSAAQEKSATRVVRAPVVQRSTEELAEASNRLYKSAKSKDDNIRKIDATIYGDEDDHKLDKAAVDRLIESVYTSATARKAASRDKVRAGLTDFKAIANKRKLTAEEIKQMGDRLCTTKQ
jgi:hypothetical protein